MSFKIVRGDCEQVLKTLSPDCIDAVVTDPPYNIDSILKRFGGKNKKAKGGEDGAFSRMSDKFLGKDWDTEIALLPDFWREVYRVLKPGGLLVSFASVNKYHKLAQAVEDAGFSIKTMIAWIYGTGNPMGRYLDKELLKKGLPEKANEVTGFHNRLKPAIEPILVAYKPFKGSMADNYLKYGVAGCFNVGACKVNNKFPTNVIMQKKIQIERELQRQIGKDAQKVSSFFYCPKPTKKEKGDSKHPTVKPERLMRYLIRLVSKKDAIVLDPFSGSGTTIVSAVKEGRKAFGIEKDTEYFSEMKTRLKALRGSNA